MLFVTRRRLSDHEQRTPPDGGVEAIEVSIVAGIT